MESLRNVPESQPMNDTYSSGTGESALIKSDSDAVEALPKDEDQVRVAGFVQVRKRAPPPDVRVQAIQSQILESN